MIRILRPAIRLLRPMIHGLRPVVRSALGLAAALEMLGGCAVGPNYQPPALADGADSPLLSRTSAVETTVELPDDWWCLYHDV